VISKYIIAIFKKIETLKKIILVKLIIFSKWNESIKIYYLNQIIRICVWPVLVLVYEVLFFNDGNLVNLR
jgi:hypothetical protein